METPQDKSPIVYELKELPCPIKKVLDFEKNGIKYNVTVSDQVLIQNKDGSLEMNVYGAWHKIISTAIPVISLGKDISVINNRVKSFRYMSPIYELKEVLSKWESEIEKIVEATERHFNG